MTSPDDLWKPPPAELTLSSAEIHVWRASLDPAAACIERLQNCLSAEELQRVRAYEQGSKNRGTLLKQIDRRINAAS